MRTLFEFPDASYFSRELSWLAFNDRVLDEAADLSTPLLERLKFLVIVSTNLEEFFRVRVAALFQKDDLTENRDGIPVIRLRERVRNWVYEQKQRQAFLFDDVVRQLAKEGLHIELGPSDLAEQIFEERVLPAIKPRPLPSPRRLKALPGGKLFVLVKLKRSRALIEIPPELGRLQIVGNRVFPVERLIANYKDRLFRDREVEEVFSFKLSRDAEMEIDDDSDDPIKMIEEGIKDRASNEIVRFEVDSPSLNNSVGWLQAALGVPYERLYAFWLPLDLKDFMQLTELPDFRKLRYDYPEPKRPRALPAGLKPEQYFAMLDRQDVLLHHPFSSFDPITELVQNAAKDPAVTRIGQTLYRTSGSSPILSALMDAAKAGKKVTALVELKARFDEANNIRWARALEEAGAEVIYGAPELKIHAKLTYIERKAERKRRGYVHISTGNYHPRTARLYTDLALLTSDPAHARDARQLFDLFEKMNKRGNFSKLVENPGRFAKAFRTWVVAPSRLHDRIVQWIHRETKNARAGKPSGIRVKLNGLVEPAVIDALYKASQAGVPVDLIVRGMCCLRPGVRELRPGKRVKLSENIRVRSLVDKYLEHSRIFIFENAGDRQVWVSSADWMPRNFFRRIELAVPILNPAIRDYLSDVYWGVYSRDNVRMRECTSEGFYVKATAGAAPPVRAQLVFERLGVPDFPPEF